MLRNWMLDFSKTHTAMIVDVELMVDLYLSFTSIRVLGFFCDGMSSTLPICEIFKKCPS